jgi:ATP-dependent RNA helicase DHX29
MAKKKKATANPARGFATTSITSKNKTKTEENVQSSKEIHGMHALSANSERAKMEVEDSAPQEAKEVHQLTPEELEEQLEMHELQLITEQNAAKVRRESSRQVARYETDSRLLRTQAQPLLREWLPEEMVAHIIDEARGDVSQKLPENRQAQSVSEDDTVVRLWTLQQTLSGLGIAQDHIPNALKAVLALNTVKDTGNGVWGLDESLGFLAKELKEEELPSFDTRDRRSRASTSRDVSNECSSKSTRSTQAKDSLTAATSENLLTSRPPTPSSKDDELNLRTPSEAGSGEGDFEVSDIDSDLEPDELVSVYVSTKAKLFRLRPDLVETRRPGSKKTKTLRENTSNRIDALPFGLRKLQAKLRKIEADPLFDSQLGDQQWLLKRIELLREASLEKRRPGSTGGDQHNTDSVEDSSQPETGIQTPNDTDSNLANNKVDFFLQDSENDDILGNMFDSSLEGGDDPKLIHPGLESSQIQLRDFGRISGLHPRRVLEDSCRARDSHVRISYRIASPNSYACRHSVTISWSIPQEKISTAVPPSVSLEQVDTTKRANHVSSITVVMNAIATPDTQQSVACVATAALFCLFANSLTESKSYLKLPPTWRELYQEFGAYQRQLVDAADRATIKSLRELIQERRKNDQKEEVAFPANIRTHNAGQLPPEANREPTEMQRLLVDSEHLKKLWEQKSSSAAYQRMLPYRANLPIASFRDSALAAIDGHQVLILCGETGCGKSTQLPAYILEHELSRGRACKIYCTEPRRISAITLAQRVSEELGEQKGDLGTSRSLVGYAIRLESKIASHTRLVYATVGIVLRMLESSRNLDDLTHLIIDEVHERSIETDFLLIILKSLMIRRPSLKVILMSATVDANRFSQYLNNAPIIDVPGRTFPVQRYFLEDAIELTHYARSASSLDQQIADDDEDVEERKFQTDGDLQGYSIDTRNFLKEYNEYQIDYGLIIKLMEHLISDPTYATFSSAILVFLPGIAEIRELHDMLIGHSSFAQSLVYPLHSSISSEEQQQAFVVPPAGVQKIVLSTNIAETGITIPDITCVIDCGRHREMRFDERRQVSRLIQSFISRANAKQRRGRAGRVQEGLCFHLFTKHRHDHIMPEQQTPEMLRLSLQDLVMRVKICKLGDIEQTLAQALDPPAPKNIRRSIDTLIEVGALTPNQELTTLGVQLAKLPLDAVLGKLCLLTAVFGCLDVGITIAAIISSKSPFVTPFGARQQADQARLSFSKGDSDLLTVYNAYSAWKRVSQSRDQSVIAFCRKYFLSPQNLTAIEDLKGQLLSAMSETGMVPSLSHPRYHPRNRHRTFVEVPQNLNLNNANETITSSVIAWSFYPKLLIRDGKGWRNVSNSQIITLHPTSVNKTNTSAKYLSYYSIMQSSSSKNYNASSTTAVHELPLLLLAGEADFKIHAGVITIDGNRLKFSVKDWKTAIALKVLRERMEELVEVSLAKPGKTLSPRLTKWMQFFEMICGPDGLNGKLAIK